MGRSLSRPYNSQTYPRNSAEGLYATVEVNTVQAWSISGVASFSGADMTLTHVPAVKQPQPLPFLLDLEANRVAFASRQTETREMGTSAPLSMPGDMGHITTI